MYTKDTPKKRIINPTPQLMVIFNNEYTAGMSSVSQRKRPYNSQ